jgi:hypothetical protein
VEVPDTGEEVVQDGDKGVPQCWRKQGVTPDSPGDLSLREGRETPEDPGSFRQGRR